MVQGELLANHQYKSGSLVERTKITLHLEEINNHFVKVVKLLRNVHHQTTTFSICKQRKRIFMLLSYSDGRR